jgi:polyisoprenoid-binding protein YceI
MLAGPRRGGDRYNDAFLNTLSISMQENYMTLRRMNATPITLLFSLAAGLFVLTSMACGNPADHVPAAHVKEAADGHDGDASPQTTRAASTEVFTISEGSSIGFSGSNVGGTHDGGFNSFEGTITRVKGEPAKSRIELTIDTTSLWADDDRLAGHLKSADFFDVETHSTATFTSTEIVAEGDSFSVTGNLTLHGITKSITFPATITYDEGKVMAKAEFSIMRFDFDIVYPGRPDDLIRDEVVVRFDVEATPSGV